MCRAPAFLPKKSASERRKIRKLNYRGSKETLFRILSTPRFSTWVFTLVPGGVKIPSSASDVGHWKKKKKTISWLFLILYLQINYSNSNLRLNNKYTNSFRIRFSDVIFYLFSLTSYSSYELIQSCDFLFIRLLKSVSNCSTFKFTVRLD